MTSTKKIGVMALVFSCGFILVAISDSLWISNALMLSVAVLALVVVFIPTSKVVRKQTSKASLAKSSAYTPSESEFKDLTISVSPTNLNSEIYRLSVSNSGTRDYSGVHISFSEFLGVSDFGIDDTHWRDPPKPVSPISIEQINAGSVINLEIEGYAAFSEYQGGEIRTAMISFDSSDREFGVESHEVRFTIKA